MKTDIHPQLYNLEVRCTCGNTFETTSTLPNISLTTCSQCHPYFTGSQRFVDAAGRIDRFNKKFGKNKA